jgi:hypothetical protein
MSETKLISKLSVKTAGCNPRRAALLENDSVALPMVRIFGFASGVKTVEDRTTGNVHEAIIGNFEAHNLAPADVKGSGDRYRSGVLYLPKGIHESLVDAVKTKPEGSESIAFDLEVRAVKATNPIGYSYEAVSMRKMAGYDPLDALRGEKGDASLEDGSATVAALINGASGVSEFAENVKVAEQTGKAPAPSTSKGKVK